jgi:hypothetical protein
LFRAEYPPNLFRSIPFLFHVVPLLATTHFLHRFCLISKKTGHQLFRYMNNRATRKVAIITTKLGFEEWGGFLGACPRNPFCS